MSGGGISLPALNAPAISGAGSIIVYAASKAGQAVQSANNNALSGQTSGQAVQFRPPQWSQPALTMITVPAAYAGAINPNASTNPNATNQTINPTTQQNGVTTYSVTDSLNPSSTPPNAVPQMLVFDAVMRASHSQRARPTLHPIQDNANVTDHVVLEPARLMLDILMTDVLPPYAEGQWVGNASKSIACFTTLDNLRAARVPLVVTTRLKSYQNMIIVDITPDDTVKTRYGLRATVELQQIFLFNVATSVTSARTQTTGSTALGQTAVAPVPAGVVSQNGVPTSSAIQQQTGTVIGAGNWSDNNASQLMTFLRSGGGGS
jgi:hypothetical protein